jgi:RNA polymerase sigma-70 factor, ECF subfamily
MSACAIRLYEVARLQDADPLLPLIARVREGDLAAFDALYRQTRADVHGVLYRLVGTNADMEDLIQDAYVQILKAVRRWRGEARFSTFLYRVCANVGLMYLRSGRRRKEDPVEEVPERPAGGASDPERTLQVRRAAAVMQRALDRMDDKKRVVFVYHDVLGMKPEEIALALEIPVNTARSRLNRAREEFTELVKALGPEVLDGVA